MGSLLLFEQRQGKQLHLPILWVMLVLQGQNSPRRKGRTMVDDNDLGLGMMDNDADQDLIVILEFSTADLIADYEEWMEAIATSPR